MRLVIFITANLIAEPTGLEFATSDVTGQVSLGSIRPAAFVVSNLKKTWPDVEC